MDQTLSLLFNEAIKDLTSDQIESLQAEASSEEDAMNGIISVYLVKHYPGLAEQIYNVLEFSDYDDMLYDESD
jgi:hypothetical protein